MKMNNMWIMKENHEIWIEMMKINIKYINENILI